MALRVDRVSVAGTWWRQTPHGSDPLWLATPPSSRRWQRGEQLAREGCRGILYASAARPRHRALCLFRDGIAVPGGEPVRPPQTHRDPPAPPRGMRT